MSTPKVGPASKRTAGADAPAAGEAAAERPRCRCGHDRHHPMVSADPHYSGIGWAAILTGISAPAKSMAFKCRVCDQIIETITDPEEIKKVRVYG